MSDVELAELCLSLRSCSLGKQWSTAECDAYSQQCTVGIKRRREKRNTQKRVNSRPEIFPRSRFETRLRKESLDVIVAAYLALSVHQHAYLYLFSSVLISNRARVKRDKNTAFESVWNLTPPFIERKGKKRPEIKHTVRY